MHILQFTAQKTKNLRVVEIDSEGKNVILSGKNGQGKSNIFNVIMSMLTGEKLIDPILHGEEKAEAFIDCGEFKVRKRWTAKGESIQIMMANGDIKSRPMEFLDSIVGKISFDPMELARMKPKEQRELLKSLVGLTFTDIDEEYTKVFNERTTVNSSIKGVIAQLQNAEAPDPNTPDEEITFKDELDKLNKLREKKNCFDETQEMKISIKEDIKSAKDNISGWEEEIRELQSKIEESIIDIDSMNISYDSIVVIPEVKEEDIVAVESSLSDIEAKNVAIREAKRYRGLIRESNSLKKKSDEYSEKLERLNQDKSTRIANAKFPIDGMSMDEEEIIYKGDRFTILSDGQKARVCTAISMALNPTLKVIFIRNANDLDKEGRQNIIDMAKEKGYQVWMEVIAEKSGDGFFIESGEVTSIDGIDIPKIKETQQTKES